MKRKSVSAVMAACCGEKYIASQIESILGQLGLEDELIISLDPSRDRTQEIIESFNDPRIVLIEGPGNGVIANFEHAIARASKEIIFLCDQDDVWLDGKVSRVLEAFEDKNVTAVIHDAKITDEALQVAESSFFEFHHSKKGFVQNVIRNSFIGCCMAFRRSLMPQILPFPEKLPMHDQWIGLQAMRSGSVAWIEEPLLLYRRHGGNASSLSASSLLQQIAWRAALIKALAKKK